MSLAMCPVHFAESALGKELLADKDLAKAVHLDERGLLAVLLLGERSAPNSKWAPYIASLPEKVPMVPTPLHTVGCVDRGVYEPQMASVSGIGIDANRLGPLLQGHGPVPRLSSMLLRGGLHNRARRIDLAGGCCHDRDVDASFP